MKKFKYSNDNPPLNDLKWKYNSSISTNIMQTWLKYGYKPVKKYIFITTRKEITS